MSDDKESSIDDSQRYLDTERKSDVVSEIVTNNIVRTESRKSTLNSLFSFRMGRESLQHLLPTRNRTKQKMDEDKRLKLWNKYLTERRQLNEKLSIQLNRPINELIMNTIDAYRSKYQDQLLFDYITILDPPDAQRGSPSFWQLPIRIMPKHRNIAPLESQLDVKAKCKIPEFEYIATPQYLHQETNTLERTNKLIEKWNNTPYRKNKIIEQSDRIKYIQPHKPETDELIILGTNFSNKYEQVTKLQKSVPVITITKPYEYEENPELELKSRMGSRIKKIQLKIENTILLPNCEAKKFEIIIESPKINTISQKQIILQNMGILTFRCSWRHIFYFNNKLPITSEKPDIFVFNNRDFVLMPGQIYEVKFMIQPENYGIIEEKWLLKTTPNLTQITFNLWANVDNSENITSLKSRLFSISNKNQSVINPTKDLFKKLNINIDKNHLIPTGFITEEERFYIANLGDKKHPKYFYQKDSIESLKDFYKKILQEYPQWDLNIDKFISLIKEKYTHLTKRNQLLNELNQILKPLKHIPTEKINIEFRKRQLVYNTLCHVINQIVFDAIKLKNSLKLYLPNVKYPSYENVLPYQELNLYKDQKLFINNIEKPLNKKCLQPIDHRIATMNDKYRPPMTCTSRMKQSIELSNPYDRYLIYKETTEENDITNQKKTAVPKSNTKVTKTILPVKSVNTGGGVGSSEISETDIASSTGADQINKMKFYRETLYLKTYLHLLKAIDEITSIIESCNLSARKPTMAMLKQLYNDLEYIT